MLPVFAAAAAPQLYVWPTEDRGEDRLVLAATLPDGLAGGSTLRFQMDGPSTRAEVTCAARGPEMHCAFSPLVPRRSRSDRSQAAPLGHPAGEELRVFAGTRLAPEAPPRRAERRKRERDRPDGAQSLLREPVFAVVVDLPLVWLGEAGPTTVEAALVDRTWAGSLFGAPAGCAGQVQLRLEADPWTPLEQVELTVSGQTLSVPPATTVVLPESAVAGLVVQAGPDRCALSGPFAHTVACGATQIAAHARPLCSVPPTDVVLQSFGRPTLSRPPERVDGLDRTIDGLQGSLFSGGPLLLDTSRRCRADAVTFLENERALATGRSPQTPGGRTPGGQAYDVLLTHGVNGPDRLPPGAPFWGDAPASEAPLRNDGQLPPPVLPTFPWLAAP